MVCGVGALGEVAPERDIGVAKVHCRHAVAVALNAIGLSARAAGGDVEVAKVFGPGETGIVVRGVVC